MPKASVYEKLESRKVRSPLWIYSLKTKAQNLAVILRLKFARPHECVLNIQTLNYQP